MKVDEERLKKDLDYVLLGIDCHRVLAAICPPRLGLEVLEPGCGTGKLGIWYWMRHANVVLLDYDPNAIEYAKELWERTYPHWPGFYRQPISFKVGSIHKLPYLDNTFDFVFNEGVAHHWGHNPHDWRRQRSINEMARVTKPGGYVCIVGSNALCPPIWDMVEKLAELPPYPGMPSRQKPFYPQGLAIRLMRAGLKLGGVLPVSGDWQQSMLLAGWGQKP